MRLLQRTTTIAGAALLAALSISACSSSSSSAGANQSSTKLTKATFVNPLASYPGWFKLQQCFDAEGAKHGITVTNTGPTGSNIDVQVMVQDIQQAVAQGTQAIVTWAPDQTTLTPALNAARSNGVHVGTVISQLSYPNTSFDVGVNLAELGKVIMDGLGQKDPNAHILTISQSKNQAGQQGVLKGFWDEASAKFPNIKMVPPIYDQGVATNTLSLVTSALTAHPDITAIYELEGAGTNGVAAAIAQKGLTGKVLLVANDAPPSTRALIDAGKVYGVGVQSWCLMGTTAMDKLITVGNGGTVNPKVVNTGSFFVTKANLSSATEQD